MTDDTALLPVLALARSWAAMALERPATVGLTQSPRLKVQLDCAEPFEALFRSALDFVDYVDSEDADVRVHVTETSCHLGRCRCSVAFIGMGRFQGIQASAQLSGIRRRTPTGQRLEPTPVLDEAGVLV